MLPFVRGTLAARYEQYISATCAMEEKLTNQRFEKPLTVHSLAGLFLLVLSGSLLSWLIFAAEIGSSLDGVKKFASARNGRPHFVSDASHPTMSAELNEHAYTEPGTGLPAGVSLSSGT